MLLGPTEARIARYLEHATRRGRVTLRTVDLAAATQLERSEAYRITRRLRELGLFGVENDRGATKGGRRYWRTPVEHDGQMLDGARHRAAWGRIVGWARTRRDLLHDRLADLRASMAGTRASNASRPPHSTRQDGATPHVGLASARSLLNPPGGERADSFPDRMRRHGLGPLMDEWAGPRIAR